MRRVFTNTVTIVLVTLTTLAASDKDLEKYLQSGEILEPGRLEYNGSFTKGTHAGTIDARADGWTIEISPGETTGYWQTPDGPIRDGIGFLYLGRGHTRISDTNVQITRNNPPPRLPDDSPYCLQTFPYHPNRPYSLNASSPPIAVRQGEASSPLTRDVTVKTRGALILQGEAWIPDHEKDIAPVAKQTPHIFATLDFEVAEKSITSTTQIRIPINLGEFGEWRWFHARIDWKENLDKIWIEWRFFDPKGRLILPKGSSNHPTNAKITEQGTEYYPFQQRDLETPWSACATILKTSPEYALLDMNNRQIRPRIIIGSWFAAESSLGLYPATGEAYFRNIQVREVKNPHPNRP